MTSMEDDSSPDRKRKKPSRKGPDDIIKKTAVVLREGVVFKNKETNEVFMPTTITMSNEINPDPRLRQEISFTKSMTPEDIKGVLKKAFPILANTERIFCAKAVQKLKLNFCGERGIWSGKVLNKEIKGHSVLYIYCEEENSDQHPPLIAQVENMQISRDESLSEDHSDSGVETCNNSQDTSKNGDPSLSSTIRTSSPEPDRYRSNDNIQLFFPLDGGTENSTSAMNALEFQPTVGHNSESEENMQDSLSRNSPNNAEVEQRNQDVVQETSQNNAEVEETNQDVVQDISHSQVEVDEPNHIAEQEQSHSQMDAEEPNHNVEQEQLVHKICPSSSSLEGGEDFQISMKEELPEHIQSGYAYFGDKRVVLTKFHKIILEGKIPAAEGPGVVKVRVFSDTGEFLGETNFEYEDMMNKVVLQAVQCGPDETYKLLALVGKHTWNHSSSANQSSSTKQNSGQVTGALNDSYQGRSSLAENAVMNDEYEDLAQHFHDIMKWLSEQSLHPVHSNTDIWLKLSNAGHELCRKLACSEDEENFKGNQQTCPPEREENYFADAENSSCMSSEDDSTSPSNPYNWSETFRACTEAEEDLDGDQLSCTQERDENYFPGTEDYSSVSSETDSALSNSESWDESLSDSSLSFPWVNSRSSKSQEAISETESTQHSHKAVNSKLDVSHEILAPMIEGFTSEDSIGDKEYVGSGVCHKWNTSLPESKSTEENCEKDNYDEMQDSRQELASYSEERTSHTLLASHDGTPVLCIDVPALNVENEESQHQDDELFETLYTSAKPQPSEAVRCVTSNQQSVTHPGPITQEAAQSPLSNPLWTGDSKLNMALPQCSDEKIHSSQEWEESAIIEGEGLASCKNEDAGKNEHSRWEMSSIEPNKTDGGVEKDVFDSKEELSQEQGLFSEQWNQHIHLSLPDFTSGWSRCLFAEGFIFHKNFQLHSAARSGHTDIVRLHIENGADVNKGRWGTPLFEAARNGHTDIVRLLLENGADVNKGRGDTPLFEAARIGHTHIVRLPLENGANVNKERGIFQLRSAARSGHTDIVRLHIENGADVSKGRWDTLFSVAARYSHTNIVRLLLENGADVNKGGWGTPLFEAARNGHTDIVRLLLQNGADVNKGRGDTPLFEAARIGHTDIVRLLLENGANVNKGRGDTPLSGAVRNGHTDIVRLLIENGADVNKGRWNFPLTGAARNGHTNIVRLLIENGADVNKGRWDTPLFEAARNGHTDIVRLLIENGADVNKGRWDTLLSGAVRNCYTTIASFLMENVPDNDKGRWDTPLSGAARNGHTNIVRLLIENGADVNKGGWDTPLFEAARNGHTDIVRLLIKNGAGVNKGGEDTLLSGAFDTIMKLFEESLRRKFEADARDTKLSLERVLDVQLRGKKIASLPKRLGKKLKTQTEMTSPRDIVEEGKCGKDSMTDVELGLNCLHLSPRCVQFKPFIMEESPGDSSIIHHYFKTINKRMDRVTLTDVGNAKQDHCVVVEKAKTHPNGDTIIIYGRKINEEGSSLGEVFQLATKDLKDAWEDEEMIAENVEIGSVVKYVQVGDDFLFQGNTKRPRWDKERIFPGLSCTDGAHRGTGNSFPNSKRIEKDRYEGCTPKETSYFISLKCGVVENDRISVITKLGELFNLKLNCREDVFLPLSPSTLELSHVEDNKDVVDGGDEPKEKSVEAENPEADPEEKDDENGNTF